MSIAEKIAAKRAREGNPHGVAFAVVDTSGEGHSDPVPFQTILGLMAYLRKEKAAALAPPTSEERVRSLSAPCYRQELRAALQKDVDTLEEALDAVLAWAIACPPGDLAHYECVSIFSIRDDCEAAGDAQDRPKESTS